jgi:hypothetical protein
MASADEVSVPPFDGGMSLSAQGVPVSVKRGRWAYRRCFRDAPH